MPSCTELLLLCGWQALLSLEACWLHCTSGSWLLRLTGCLCHFVCNAIVH
jgi:hypothetical protein